MDQVIFKHALSEVSPKAELHYASNAFEAFFKLASEEVCPDYIFIDLKMRFMDGVGFLQRIKSEKSFRNIPVIVHSPSPESARVEELKASGAWAIQFKPYEYLSLCNALHIYFGLGISGLHLN